MDQSVAGQGQQHAGQVPEHGGVAEKNIPEWKAENQRWQPGGNRFGHVKHLGRQRFDFKCDTGNGQQDPELEKHPVGQADEAVYRIGYQENTVSQVPVAVQQPGFQRWPVLGLQRLHADHAVPHFSRRQAQWQQAKREGQQSPEAGRLKKAGQRHHSGSGVSKLMRSSSTTSGRFMTWVRIAPTYSPSRPIKNS